MLDVDGESFCGGSPPGLGGVGDLRRRRVGEGGGTRRGGLGGVRHGGRRRRANAAWGCSVRPRERNWEKALCWSEGLRGWERAWVPACFGVTCVAPSAGRFPPGDKLPSYDLTNTPIHKARRVSDFIRGNRFETALKFQIVLSCTISLFFNSMKSSPIPVIHPINTDRRLFANIHVYFGKRSTFLPIFLTKVTDQTKS